MVQKIKSEAEYCECCGKTTKGETQAWYCDNCDKEIEWNVNNGFNHTVRLWHGNSYCGCGKPFPEWQFCSQKCLFEWLRNAMENDFNKHNITGERAQVEFKLHPNELITLINSLTQKVNGDE